MLSKMYLSEEAVKLGLLQGSNNSFRPDESATRGESAQVLLNLLKAMEQ